MDQQGKGSEATESREEDQGDKAESGRCQAGGAVDTFRGWQCRSRTELGNEGQVGTASGTGKGKSLKAGQMAWGASEASLSHTEGHAASL